MSDTSAHIPLRREKRKCALQEKRKKIKIKKKNKVRAEKRREVSTKHTKERAYETVGNLKMISTVRQSEGSLAQRKPEMKNGNADNYGDANREGMPERE